MKMKEVVVEEEEEEGEGEGEEEEEEEDEDDDIIVEEENKKKIRALLTPCGVRKVTTSTGSGGSTQQQPSCQVDDCEANLKEAKPYHRRHKVCELHSKAPTVIIAGIRKRFCQQCSRFESLIYISIYFCISLLLRCVIYGVSRGSIIIISYTTFTCS